MENDQLHLNKFIKRKWTLHQLTHVFDHGVLDLEVLGADEQGHRSDEGAYLFTDDALAALIRASEVIDILLSVPQHLIINLYGQMDGVCFEAEALAGVKQLLDVIFAVFNEF